MAALDQAQGHVAAHAAQADHPHLHGYLTADRTAAASARQPAAGFRPSVTRSTGRRRDVSDCRSPIACACLSTEKLYGCPGIGTSLASSWTTCRKRPVFGPPLCSCPVECRNRGPYPEVVAIFVRSLTAVLI